MKGYKGFDKDMKCRGFQYEIGKEYETDSKPVRCTENGFHFCENPLDILNYYDLCDSEFCEVEATGSIDLGDGEDTKVATDKIKIGAKIGLSGFVKASFDFLWERCKQEEKGNGHSSQLAASGNYSQLAASGDYSQLDMQGKNSVGAAIGIDNIIKGVVGDWITLAEWKRVDGNYTPICVKSAQIDGEIIKADTWYILKNGEFAEVE